MIYPQRKNGEIIGFARWPNRQTDKTPIEEDSAEFQEFLNRPKPKKPGIEGMTNPERIKLIDFLQTNSIVTAARANKLKGN
jgi:hypothetical protein